MMMMMTVGRNASLATFSLLRFVCHAASSLEDWSVATNPQRTWLRYTIKRPRTCHIADLSHFTPMIPVLSCLVGGVNRIGDKSRLFSVVLTAFRDWAKQFRYCLSPTVLTYRQFCSHCRHGQLDKTRQDSLVLSLSSVWTWQYCHEM